MSGDGQRRLRVLHVLVQPVLVWDDGETLTPGPEVNVAQVPLGALGEMPEQIAQTIAAYQDGDSPAE